MGFVERLSLLDDRVYMVGNREPPLILKQENVESLQISLHGSHRICWNEKTDPLAMTKTAFKRVELEGRLDPVLALSLSSDGTLDPSLPLSFLI